MHCSIDRFVRKTGLHRASCGRLVIALASVFAWDATTARGQCPTGHLFATDGASWDLFGYSAAISGDTVVISVVNDDRPVGQDAGSAFIFVRNAGTWAQQAQLLPNPPGSFDQFGYTSDIDGDTAVVGANLDNTNFGTNCGSVWVFDRNGGAWPQVARLLAPNALPNDIFGTGVAIDGDWIIAGAPGVDTLGSGAGSAYVFRRQNGIWTFTQQLFASDGAAGDQFGFSLKMDGDTAVISAMEDDTTAGTNAGSVYVFRRGVNDVWTEEAHLFASDAVPNDNFGYGLGISGDTIVVGATGIYPPDGTNAGKAYIFERDSDGNWIQRQILTSLNPSPMEHFGWSVAVDANKALIGAPFNPELGGGPDIGSAYTFVRGLDGIWTHDKHIESNDGAPGDIFGFYVALEGATAVVTADFDDTPASIDAGSAYVFDLACSPVGDLNCDNAVNLADVPHFIDALLNPGTFTGCDVNRADMNSDLAINGRDTQAFVAALMAP